jgi:hypothetical protein
VEEELVFLNKILYALCLTTNMKNYPPGSRLEETALALADIVPSTDFILLKAMMIFLYYAYICLLQTTLYIE